MRTIPLPEQVPPGTLAVGNGLMVRFKKDNQFWVYNGNWNGMFDGELIYVIETNEYFPAPEPFEEVVELDKEDRRRWYLPPRMPIVQEDRPLDEEDDEIPF